VLAGSAPALLAGRGDLVPTLKAGPREGTSQRSRLRVVLLVAQGALSVVLLIGAALFVRSLRHAQQFRMGYDAEPVLLVSTSMRGVTIDSAQRAALHRALLARAQSIPGAASAAVVTSVPFWSTSSMGLYVAGIDSVRRLGRFTYQLTTPDYFRTVGTRILRGRGLTAADRDGAPRVAVVSESMGRALWPGRDALGECLHVAKPGAPCTTVVGVAEDIVQQQDQLTDPKRYQYYLPLEQAPTPRWSDVVVRMVGDPAVQTERVRKAMQTVMPGQSYVTVRPMIEIVDTTRRSWRLGASLFVAFGALALVVAAVGLYGVMAYDVTQRRHELGVRVALGARAADILRLVAGQGARVAVAGVVLGSALALVAARWVEPLLFQQSARDPVVYGGVAALMLVVGLLASASPAMRATAADPNTALRSE
jgi:predicted permease